MTTTATEPKLRRSDRLALELKAQMDADGTPVTFEEARHLLACAFIEKLRNEG